MDESGPRVADYFITAGLPADRNRLQLLDEYSLEVNLKPSACEDPIIDITVIFPGLGENVPDYYQLVEFTPSGLPANLNHGSFRAPEAFLCFRRGRNWPPLVDLGVLYKDKDRLMPDSQLVQFTPGDRTANVNNVTNSLTFLTYRRATESSPCNELVVMDICVIIASKGEKPPHSYKIINKNLNRGLMASDVYICYKKSMNRANLVSYKPCLLSRFPLKNNPSYALEETVALFCLPMGATIECWPANAARSLAVNSSFVLTLADRSKVYASAITFYEELDEHKYPLTEEQKVALQLNKYTRKEDRNIFYNKCICILSRWPFFDAFEKFLFFLHKRQLMGPYDIPLEKFVAHFLHDIPFPSPARPRILIQLSSEERIALSQPEELPLPRSGASFRQLLLNLGPDNCLLLLLLALTEQKILIHSHRPVVLTSVAEAVMQIIFPFYWQCPYIPLCPIGMSDYLSAPLPFVIGLDSRFFDLYDQPSDVNAVDLDTRTVSVCEEKKDLCAKLLPKKASRNLKGSLTNLLEKCRQHEQYAHKLQAHMDDGAIDFDFTLKRKEMQLEMEIREAFLQFSVSILSGYRDFLLPITKAPTVGATDVRNLFNQEGFLMSRDKNFHKFYQMLMRTQMFTKFIEERSFVSETNTCLAYFDDCVDRVTHEEYPRFLELEWYESDRTVFILPPEPDKENAEFKYDTFQLDPSLYPEPAEKPEEPKQSEFYTPKPILSTPASKIARRTKHEIRSAQKLARKHINSPYSWGKCLISTSFSLWFIHLPSFMLASPSRQPQILRVGLVLLQRMNRLRLYPADEICYRVMMQLCGIYNQPMLAVKVLFEMRKTGMHPNAVTYGYYNKAVLESEWPTGDTTLSEGYKKWNKIRICLLGIAIFKRVGREGNFLEMRQKSTSSMAVNVVENQSSSASTKDEPDAVSQASSEDRLSCSNEDAQTNGDREAKESSSRMSEGDIESKINEEVIESELEFRERVSSIVKQEGQSDNPHNLDEKADNNTQDSASNTSTCEGKGQVKYSDIRNKHLELFQGSLNFTPPGTGSAKKVSRSLFTEFQDETGEQQNNFISGIEAELLDDSVIAEDNAENIAFSSEGKTKQWNGASEQESNGNFKTPLPPSKHPSKTRSSSSSSMKSQLQGTPVTENDPLGALSSPENGSPAHLTKSATLPAVEKQKPDDSILGSPFANDSSLSRETNTTVSSGSMSSLSSPFSLKSLTKSGSSVSSKLSSLKKMSSAYLSPNAATQERLSHGLASVRSYVNTVSKRVEEIRESVQVPGTGSLSPAGSYQFLSTPEHKKTIDDDAMSTTSTVDSRRPSGMTHNQASVSQVAINDQSMDTWSSLTGALWDQFWGGSVQQDIRMGNNQLQKAPPKASDILDTIEHLYNTLPRQLPAPEALQIIMTSCTRCVSCQGILYDEEIMSGWTAEDSNLNTKCLFCGKMFVPFLHIRVIDYREIPAMKADEQGDSEENKENVSKKTEMNAKPKTSPPITAPYISPLVLRKELENVLETDGDECLINPHFVDSHPIIYWNLLWYFERIAIKSHLPALALKAESLKYSQKIDSSWEKADHFNVSILTNWDNPDFHDPKYPPLYSLWQKNDHSLKTVSSVNFDTSTQSSEHRGVMQHIIDGVQRNNLIEPLKTLLQRRENLGLYSPSKESTNNGTACQRTPRSVYRDILFLTLVSLGQDNIDLHAFNREYRRAYENLPKKFDHLVHKCDKPPDMQMTFCRRFFRPLRI